MAVSKQQQGYSRKWNEKTYERLYPFVRKGKKAYYLNAVKIGGYTSLNDFIEKTLDEKARTLLGFEFSPEIDKDEATADKK